MAEENVLSNNGEVVIKEQVSKVIVSFIYYNSLVRDTLEYTLVKLDYNPDFFKYKQNGIINEPKVNSPLHNFIATNGEKGQEFLKRLEDFGEKIYGENSTILHLASDGLRVDHGQHLAIFESVMPLHDEISQIINLHYEFAKKEGKAEEVVEQLIKADERFYRGIVLMTISLELQRQFEEFNKIMNENKGQKSASSNYVEQELSKLVALYERSKALAKCTDELYTVALDHVGNMIEMMRGKRDLPAGKNFPEVFKESQEKCRAFVTDAEPKWKELYEPCVRILVSDAQKAAAARAAANHEKEA